MRQGLLITCLLLVVAAVIGYRYYSHRDKTEDRLCAIAAKYQMHCVQLASPSVYDHGAYVRLQGPELKELSLPSDYIFSVSCTLKPESTAFSHFKEDSEQYIGFGSHTFKLDRSLTAGAELNLPKLAGLHLKAGPRLSEIRSVTLEADSAHYFNIDTSEFLRSLATCNVRPACASIVRSDSVRVIKRLLVAKNLRYRVETTSGETESLSAAVKSNNLTLGIDSNASTKSIDDLSSGKDMVFAVDFFDPTELKSANTCQQSLAIISVTGKTIANASSGAPNMQGVQQESAHGDEVSAQERAPDAPDRKGLEGMKDPEARAWGLWNFDSVTQSLGLYQRTMVDPGTRWMSDSKLHEIPGSLRIWAVPKATLQNEVELTLTSQVEELRTIVATVTIDRKTSASLIGKTPLYSYFKTFILISQDGTEHRVPPVWSGDQTSKEFELGRIAPSETVKIRIGRELSSSARSDDEAGAVQEDITVKFALK